MMDVRDRNLSVDSMSSRSIGNGVGPNRATPGTLSISSSVTTRSRRTSKIELVKMHGGSVLLEVDEVTDGNISLPGKGRDSLSGATTIAGITAEADTKYLDKLIKKEVAHHNSEIGAKETRVANPNESSESTDQDNNSNAEPRQRYIILNLLHHTYLALASPALFRVPALAHKWNTSTGSGFLFAYVIMVIIVATPLCALESIMAQFSSLGTITIFRCLPVLTGIGFGMVMLCFLLMLYSSTILSWSVIYTVYSFQKPLLWTHCPSNVSKCTEVNTYGIAKGGSNNFPIPSEYFFLNNVLEAFRSEEGNGLSLSITVVLGFIWLGQLFLLMLGKPWISGVVSKAISLVTLAMFLALMIIGLELEGSGRGLSSVFRLEMKDLANPDIWVDALGQAMWTLGPTFGFLIARASYRNFGEMIRPDVYTASAANILVALMVTLAIFPYFGHLYPTDRIDKTPGFFFVISSYAMTKLPIPQMGGVILYLGLSKALLDHTHMLASTTVISISDLLPSKWRTGGRKFFCQSILCILGFACTLPFVITEGLFLTTAVDTYVPWVSALTLGFLELVGFVYIYGANNISTHFKIMTRKSTEIFVFLWKFVLPPIFLGLAVWISVVGIANPLSWEHLQISSEKMQIYKATGIILALLPLSFAVFITLIMTYKYKKNLKSLLIPKGTWGPALAQHRALYSDSLRKAMSKTPYLFVEVENEVIESESPIKDWMPYGFFMVPSKFSALCKTEGFSPTDTLTKVKIARHLQEHFGSLRAPDDDVEHQKAPRITQQSTISSTQELQGNMNEEMKPSDLSGRIHSGSTVSAGILLNPSNITVCSSEDEVQRRQKAASFSFDNLTYNKD